MGIKSRIDGRTVDNSSITIKNSKGEIVAKVELLDQVGVTLEISTKDGLYLEKPNGWKSKQTTNKI